MNLELTLNGRPWKGEASPSQTLLDFLRAQGLASVKRGCDTENCGLCTVWVDDAPVLSCSYLACRATGRRVTTLEGVEEQAAERERQKQKDAMGRVATSILGSMGRTAATQIVRGLFGTRR